jgi:hypothetical protein
VNGSDDHRRDYEDARNIREMKRTETEAEPRRKPALDGVRDRARCDGEAPDTVASK